MTDLPDYLRTCEPSILVCQGIAGLIVYLDDAYKDDPLWQFSFTQMKERNEWRGDKAAISRFVFSHCGFMRPNGHGKNHYHYCLDPDSFVNDPLDFTAVIRFAKSYCEFLKENDLPFKCSAGSLATQFLRDKRFYSAPRRKVPKSTNDKARAALPGNYYRLLASRNSYYKAVYIDQDCAHHVGVLNVPMPDSELLLARGRFRHCDDRAWITPRKDVYAWTTLLNNQFGLIYARIWTPKHDQDIHHPLAPKEGGSRLVWMFTNELSVLAEYGGEIDYVIAAWTSGEQDLGLKKYATWALDFLEAVPGEHRKWIKRILLAVYGVLASRSEVIWIGCKHGKGTEKELPIYQNEWVKVRIYPKIRTESPIVNVIHRGMIEAETRKESIGYARELHAAGRDVLCIYADSLIVAAAEEGYEYKTYVPPNWSVRGHLMNLRFLDDTSFVSDEMIRLPGITGADRVRLSRV